MTVPSGIKHGQLSTQSWRPQGEADLDVIFHTFGAEIEANQRQPATQYVHVYVYVYVTEQDLCVQINRDHARLRAACVKPSQIALAARRYQSLDC